MGNKNEAPKVNAGSMADIAFLLLIFFLITTTIETDVGIMRMLPRIDEKLPKADVYERNILRIILDGEGQLLVEDELVELKYLRKLAIDFLDNGGLSEGSPQYCDYCQGERNPESSDSPAKAIISFTNNRQTSYGAYVAVQNELMAAYNLLRNREARRLYGKDFTLIEAMHQNPGTPLAMKVDLKGK